MIRRWMILAVILLVALPSLLYGRWIQDKVYLQTDSVGKVEFSHYNHLAQKSIGKNCPTCHNEVFHIVTKKNPVFTMAQMEEGQACGSCHNGKKAFSVSGDCTTCHAGNVEINYATSSGKVVFPHDVHVEMFGCAECHPDIFVPQRNSNQVGMQAMQKGESCGACHDGDTAFSVKGDCGNCHAGAEDVAIQSVVGEILFPHAAHTQKFGCDECHPEIFKPKANSNQVGMAKMREGESCGTCHDGDTAFNVSENCTTCHSSAPDQVVMQSDVGAVNFPHSTHFSMFSCDECHPGTFKAKANSNKVGMAKMKAGESCGTCHDGDTAFSVTEDCTNCHSSVPDQIAIQADGVGVVAFPHATHFDMLSCDECHPDIFMAKANSNKVGMEKMREGESCGACHDGDTAFNVTEDCTTCHLSGLDYKKDVAIKSTIWTIVFSHAVHTEIFSCEECHTGIFRAKANSNQVGMQRMEAGESCGACHDGDTAFSVKEDCMTCHNKSADIAIQANDFGSVPFSHTVHTKKFACDECHPAIFKTKANSNKVGMQKMETGASCGTCHDGSTAFGVKSDCSNCHQGAKDIAIESKVGPIIFSHDRHTSMFGCDACHPDVFKAKANSNQVGMKQMEAGASCGSCHDGDTAFSVKSDCTTCHSNAVDQILIQTKNVGVVKFPHSAHIDMFGCAKCHPGIFRPKANSNQVGMKQMETGASCGACHDGSTAFSVKEDCTMCHAGDIDYKGLGKTVFPHAAHVEMFGCESCHPSPFKAQKGANPANMEDMKNGQSCGTCHNGAKAFDVKDCGPCHQR